MILGQMHPGEWAIHSDYSPEPIPVPSWLVELCDTDEDRSDLMHALAKIYGQGRRIGTDEGITEVRADMLRVLGLNQGERQ